MEWSVGTKVRIAANKRSGCKEQPGEFAQIIGNRRLAVVEVSNGTRFVDLSFVSATNPHISECEITA